MIFPSKYIDLSYRKQPSRILNSSLLRLKFQLQNSYNNIDVSYIIINHPEAEDDAFRFEPNPEYPKVHEVQRVKFAVLVQHRHDLSEPLRP